MIGLSGGCAMNPTFRKNSNPSGTLATMRGRMLPDRTAKAVAWTVMVAICAAAHLGFMHLISPLAAALTL